MFTDWREDYAARVAGHSRAIAQHEAAQAREREKAALAERRKRWTSGRASDLPASPREWRQLRADDPVLHEAAKDHWRRLATQGLDELGAHATLAHLDSYTPPTDFGRELFRQMRALLLARVARSWFALRRAKSEEERVAASGRLQGQLGTSYAVLEFDGRAKALGVSESAQKWIAWCEDQWQAARAEAEERRWFDTVMPAPSRRDSGITTRHIEAHDLRTAPLGTLPPLSEDELAWLESPQ